jgi:hypothetical protein
VDKYILLKIYKLTFSCLQYIYNKEYENVESTLKDILFKYKELLGEEIINKINNEQSNE